LALKAVGCEHLRIDETGPLKLAKNLAPFIYPWGALLFFFVCWMPALAQSEFATGVQTVDSACARCHREIFLSYIMTPMANASGSAAERAIGGAFHHTNSAVNYRVTVDGGDPRLTYQLPGTPPVQGSVKFDYFLGSGHLGTTYLYSIDGYLFESPIAYYRRTGAYDMKPGLGKSSQMPAGLPLNDACLRCHMSSVQRADAGSDNHYSGLPFRHTGITCESCHGETQQHVSTGGKVPVVDPIQLSTAKRDSVCVRCHLEGDTSVEKRGKSILNFQPGDDISDFLSYFVYAQEDTTKRAVSEIEQFSLSKCKQASGSAMSCLNCHDPHFSPALAERSIYYRSKCMACHTQTQFARHHPENLDCTSCHMPKTGSENIPHVAWTDHRILKTQLKLESAQVARPARELLPILPSASSQRDLGLAYYNRVIDGDVSERDRAWQMLLAANQSNPGDIAVLRALGVLAEMNGQNVAAAQFYREILNSDPANLTAITNLGTLLAKSGNLRPAVALWQQAFRRNEDIAPLGTNLAMALCMLGDKDRAEETLKTVLKYSPDLRDLRSRLTAMQSSLQQCSTQ
jgi:tetratricopeptide (TPR) repeat protein